MLKFTPMKYLKMKTKIIRGEEVEQEEIGEAKRERLEVQLAREDEVKGQLEIITKIQESMKILMTMKHL